MDSLKESMRDQASFAWLDATLQDIRYALRGLHRSPGFTVTTLLSLTLGLGASLAIFTVADNLLVRPLPYRDASRLVMVWEAYPKVQGAEHNVVSPANFLDWRSQNDVLDGVAAASPVRSAVLVQNGRAEEFGARSVTADFLPLLGVRPIRGRLFTREEDRAGNASCPGLISYRLWQGWFGGDEDIIGRMVVINSQPTTIVGVLPPNFFPQPQNRYLGMPRSRSGTELPQGFGAVAVSSRPAAAGRDHQPGASAHDRARQEAGKVIPGIQHELDCEHPIDARRDVP